MTFIERRQRVTDPDGPLLLMELSAPSFPEVVRIADDTRNWESGGEVYFGVPFRFKAPDDTSGQAPRAVLELDNIGREITADLELLQAAELVTAVVKVTDRTDPETIYMQMALPMMSVSVNQAVATANIGVDFLMRQASVRLIYDPHTAPGLF